MLVSLFFVILQPEWSGNITADSMSLQSQMDGKVIVQSKPGVGSCFGSQFKAYIKQ